MKGRLKFRFFYLPSKPCHRLDSLNAHLPQFGKESLLLQQLLNQSDSYRLEHGDCYVWQQVILIVDSFAHIPASLPAPTCLTFSPTLQ